MLTDNLRHNRPLIAAALAWNTIVVLLRPTDASQYFIHPAAASATIWAVRAGRRRF
jgi:hypothetical protein